MFESNKPTNRPDLSAMSVSDVLLYVADQIGTARAFECQHPDLQPLNASLSSLELHLELKRDNSKDGKIAVNLPVIGELVPSGSYEGKVNTTTDNTLIIKFDGIKPKPNDTPCTKGSPALKLEYPPGKIAPGVPPGLEKEMTPPPQ
ncbi:hypothetical protein [Caballeronia sp. AZ10_KS36]|uniref:hypothetical protein n=1 Tax=Caballeronia sp. AZ10_KS36 TaxID=2921757 RepID=UPI002028056C|nr:hypothetical protein [Caballeronia sp. AZ10_KS36]